MFARKEHLESTGEDLPRFMERMVEYTVGTLKGKKRGLFLSTSSRRLLQPATAILSRGSIVADIGIVASRDPVAVDQASMDLLNAQPALDPSRLNKPEYAEVDKVKAVYPHIEWRHQLDYAEKVGLGSKSYDLVVVSD